jgi:hypothetical protein
MASTRSLADVLEHVRRVRADDPNVAGPASNSSPSAVILALPLRRSRSPSTGAGAGRTCTGLVVDEEERDPGAVALGLQGHGAPELRCISPSRITSYTLLAHLGHADLVSGPVAEAGFDAIGLLGGHLRELKYHDAPTNPCSARRKSSSTASPIPGA